MKKVIISLFMAVGMATSAQAKTIKVSASACSLSYQGALELIAPQARRKCREATNYPNYQVLEYEVKVNHIDWTCPSARHVVLATVYCQGGENI